MSLTQLPQPNTFWVHKKTGKKYEVLGITNQATTQPEKFPVTVVYQGDSQLWSRPVETFLTSFEKQK